jgi:glycosyltransferase involved in cell wall biosynthesis
MINNIDYVISINKEISKNLLEIGFKKNQILNIPNGVKKAVNSFGASSIKKSLNIKKSDHLISFVGTLTKKKNVGKLLNAFSLIDYESLNASLLLVGDGSEQENLTKLSKDLCIDKKTHFLGYVENVNEVLYETDIFVLPSFQEGLPNVILEAGTIGTSVICSNIPGNNDIINNKNGILFDLNSDKDLSDKIKYLLIDDKKRNEMALKLKKHVNNNYSIHKISKKYFDIYSNLINK